MFLGASEWVSESRTAENQDLQEKTGLTAYHTTSSLVSTQTKQAARRVARQLADISFSGRSVAFGVSRQRVFSTLVPHACTGRLHTSGLGNIGTVQHVFITSSVIVS